MRPFYHSICERTCHIPAENPPPPLPPRAFEIKGHQRKDLAKFLGISIHQGMQGSNTYLTLPTQASGHKLKPPSKGTHNAKERTERKKDLTLFLGLEHCLVEAIKQTVMSDCKAENTSQPHEVDSGYSSAYSSL